MTKLDDAIKLCIENPQQQTEFYDLFLNTLFYVPIMEEEESKAQEDGALPLLVEANEKTYLMLFDTIGKLTNWANGEAKYLATTGHDIAEISSSKIYWALNYGTDQQKFFEPEEIKWLKAVVQLTKESSQKQTAAENVSHNGAEDKK